MKWERMQKPLREGFQVFRQSWPEHTYVMVEDGHTSVYTDARPEGVEYTPTAADVAAVDWAATGLSGN